MPVHRTGILSRLRYSTKLAATSLIVIALSLGLLGRVLYEVNQNVEFRTSETDGIVLIRPFYELMRLAQNHWGQTDAEETSRATLQRIETLIHEIDGLDAIYGARFDTSSGWESIKSQWKAIRQNENKDVTQLSNQYIQLLDDLAGITMHVSDLSNLQLDRDLDTYYLSVSVTETIPALTNQLIRLKVATTTEHGSSVRLVSDERFSQLTKKLRRDYTVIFVASTRVRPLLEPLFDTALSKTLAHLELARSIKEKLDENTNSPELVQSRTAAHAALDALFNATIQELETRLNERIGADRRTQWITGIGTLVALTSLISLFFSLTVAIREAVSRLRVTSAKLAADQGIEAPPVDADERNEVINAIELLAKTVEEHSDLQEQEIARARTAEAAVREATTHIRQILDITLDAVIGMDSEGIVIEWNHRAESVFGWTREEAIGARLSELIVPPSLRAGHEAGYRRYVATGVGTIINSRIEINALKKSGEEFFIELAIAPLRVRDTIHFSAFVVDITERRRANELLAAKERAEAANRAKSDFLATMSHEIRTPMNGVLGMTALLMETPLSVEQREFTETIRQSGQYLLAIINDVLDFSKIEAGKLNLDAYSFDLRILIEESMDLLAERATAKNLELASFFPLDVPTLLVGDPGRIRQIFINLLGNAIKFTHQGEVVVRISTTATQDKHVELVIEVVDTGIGIDTAGQERLFKAFSQVDNTTTREYGGTGLGLAISHRLTHLMGGKIGVRSEPKKGSTFFFTLPLTKQSSEHQAPLTQFALAALVVDDNDTSRSILDTYLSAWGVKTVCVKNNQAALDALAHASPCPKFDFALVDIGNTEPPAFDAARFLAQSSALGFPPLILLAAAGRKADKTEANGLSAFEQLGKPVRTGHLYAAVQRIAHRIPTPTGHLMHAPDDARFAKTRISSQDSLIQGRIQVLVAEDNVVNQRIIVRMLEKLGVHADVVDNGAEVVPALTQKAYSAILMDCQMPEMDGFETTRLIRKIEGQEGFARQAAHIPIIAVTANALVGDRERCLEAGMDDYISKPLNRETLKTTLRKWLSANGNVVAMPETVI